MIGLQICSICTYMVFLSGVNLVPIIYLSFINVLIIIIMTIDLYVEYKNNADLKVVERKEVQ